MYTTADFERRVALRARTQAVARHLTDFLKKTDRFAKTIVFCVDQEHASEMRAALNNLNSDLIGTTAAQRHPLPSDGSPRPSDGRGVRGEGRGAGGEGSRAGGESQPLPSDGRASCRERS